MASARLFGEQADSIARKGLRGRMISVMEPARLASGHSLSAAGTRTGCVYDLFPRRIVRKKDGSKTEGG